VKGRAKGPSFEVALLIFGLLGPPVGALIFMPWLIIVLIVPQTAPFLIPAVYGLGIAPALVSGVVFAVLYILCRRPIGALIVTPLFGALAAYVIAGRMGLPLVQAQRSLGTPIDLLLALPGLRLVFAGAMAATACAAVSVAIWKAAEPSRHQDEMCSTNE
jgi:hypothetical protein